MKNHPGHWFLVAAMVVGVALGHASAQPTLLEQLGCANCHSDLPNKGNLRDLAPDLTSAGSRYNPAWLFEFLRAPNRIRRHLGPARMPNFHFSDKEALALIAFLETQTTPPNQSEIPDAIRTAIGDTPAVSPLEFQSTLTNGLVCLSCHTFDGKGGSQGVELSNTGYRLRPEWIKEYLVAPSRFGVPHHIMPSQFFDPTNQFRPLTSNAARKIQVIASHLSSIASAKRKELEVKYEAARAAFTNDNPDLGRQIFVSQNCAGCHRHHSIQPCDHVAPELTKTSGRITKPWLERFLKHPYAVRPFGYQPGQGSRMPDFGLSDQEVAAIAADLGAKGRNEKPKPLSAFSKRKARLLLTEKVSCLGCHRFGNLGGRIGPDLTRVRERLQPDYVRGIIRNPRETNPHTIMPRVPLPEKTVDLLASLLFQHEERSDSASYLSLTENPPTFGTGNYARYCAPCHGLTGRGDGFNATFLPKKPTTHSDASAMSRRPDDTLYDAIHSGGYIVNKSHAMPPWGESLSPTEIQDLVRHIRTLCQCAEPTWSRDNRK